MGRIRLMIIWGLLMSIWLTKSLFADNSHSTKAVQASVTITAEETTETTRDTTAETFEETTSIPVSQKMIPKKIEEYVVGVVAAEMPVYFPIEALKAQAVAARTYACREYFNNSSTDLYSLGQAYLSEDELKKRWGGDHGQNIAKIRSAVTQTEGEIIVYDDEPILAAFCSASGGKTENSENVWGQALPYLRSVDSSEDKNAPVYTQTLTFDNDRLSALLGVNSVSDIRITKRSAAGYVISLTVSGCTFSGNEIRQRLGLRSSDFEIRPNGTKTEVTSYGYGHGVGMSQYGACYMAESGSDHIQILEHYYTDAVIQKYTVSP